MNTTSLPKQIIVAIQKVNGKDAIMPVCPRSKSFATIAGTKSLSKDVVREIHALGYSVKVRQEIKTIHSVLG